MRRFGAIFAVGLLAGCGVSTTQLTLPTASSAQAPLNRASVAASAAAAPARSASSPPASLTLAKSVTTAPAGGLTSQPAAGPFVPRSAADMQQALRTLTGGLETADGKPFNLFDTANPPADAVTTPDPALSAAPSGASGYSTQALPETTQSQADAAAYAWAPDAQQIWVGWGYWGRWAPLSIFGQARHVYYSESKQRLLYLDYDFFRLQKSEWQSDNIVMKFAGKYITDVLDDARGSFPYDGYDAFNEARQSGYDYSSRTTADIKAICIEPIFLGPQWIFFNEMNRPAMIVDANTGEVSDSGLLWDIIQAVSYLSP